VSLRVARHDLYQPITTVSKFPTGPLEILLRLLTDPPKITANINMNSYKEERYKVIPESIPESIPEKSLRVSLRSL